MEDKSKVKIKEQSGEEKNPPKPQTYSLRVDQEKYEVDQECLTGKQILEIAGKLPVNRFQLNVKIKGKVEKVENDQIICFSNPGLEKFMTIPLDQTEGGLDEKSL